MFLSKLLHFVLQISNIAKNYFVWHTFLNSGRTFVFSIGLFSCLSLYVAMTIVVAMLLDVLMLSGKGINFDIENVFYRSIYILYNFCTFNVKMFGIHSTDGCA